MRELIKIFKALSDPNRLRILKMLEVRPLCVCEITEVLHLATSTVSKHLSLLRDADLIVDWKEGRWVNYRLNSQATNKYVKSLLPLLSEWLPADEQVQADAQTVKQINRVSVCAPKSPQSVGA